MIHELATELADEFAAGEIRSLGHDTNNREWFNITSGQNWDVRLLARSARYLDLRGLLERQPDQPNIVRPLVPDRYDADDSPF